MSSGLGRLPRLRVILGGRSLDGVWLRGLESLRVRRRLGLPSQCELELVDAGAEEASSAGLRIGAEMEVLVQTVEAQEGLLFEGEVAGIEQSYPTSGGRRLRVRAYDPLLRLQSRQTVRGHRETTVAELARDLVADLGLSVVAPDPGAPRRLIVQHRQTDLELLREHTEAVGLYATVRGNELLLVTLEGSGEVVELTRGKDLLEARFDVDGSRVWGSVAGFGWDPATGQTAEGAANRPRSGRDVPWRRPGDGGGAFSLLDLGFEESRWIEGASQGALDRVACREISVWGVAEGDARLLPGSSVEIHGVDDSLAGTYVLTSVRHTFDRRRGFLTEITSYPPPRPEPETGTSIVPGQVTSVDDPDRLGRVKASLPTFAGLETDWMRVVCPGLGADRGFVALPDVDDQVAVALTHGDPARGLVLGGIFSGRGRLDPGVEGGRVRRFQVRAGDQVVSLDEEKGTVRVENAAGSSIELGADGLVIHSAGNLHIEAPGKRLRFRAARIDMEQG